MSKPNNENAIIIKTMAIAGLTTGILTVAGINLTSADAADVKQSPDVQSSSPTVAPSATQEESFTLQTNSSTREPDQDTDPTEFDKSPSDSVPPAPTPDQAPVAAATAQIDRPAADIPTSPPNSDRSTQSAEPKIDPSAIRPQLESLSLTAPSTPVDTVKTAVPTIDEWMPNPKLQNLVLAAMQAQGLLAPNAQVSDITQENIQQLTNLAYLPRSETDATKYEPVNGGNGTCP